MLFWSSLLLLAPAVFGLIKLPDDRDEGKTIMNADHWPTCKRGPEMNDCLRGAVQIAIKDLINGNQTLGVVPLDPWRIKSFEFTRKDGPLRVNFYARNLTVSGYRFANINSVKTDWKNMKLTMSVPRLIVVGNYIVNGTVFTIPINGKGNLKVRLDDFLGDVKLNFENILKKGRGFFKVKDAELLVDASLAQLRLENLFNGNKVLGDRMNDVLNNNWRVILNIVRPLVAKGVADPLKRLAAGLFTKVPADVIVPN